MTTWMNVDAFVSIIQIRPLNKSLDTTLILRSRVDIRAFCLELETVFFFARNELLDRRQNFRLICPTYYLIRTTYSDII